MHSLRHVPALFALVCLLAACSPSTSPAPTADTGSQALIRERESGIAFITRLYERDGMTMADADFVEWLTGDAAIRAIREDDPECATRPDATDCTPPNDFYVRNRAQSVVSLRLSDNVRIRLQVFEPGQPVTEQDVSLEQFSRAVGAQGGRISERYRFVPFWITEEDGVVSGMREQYVP